MAKFNFLQNQPQQNLSNYLSMVYGNPMGRVTNQQTSGPSFLQNALGIAAVGGGLYRNLGGQQGISNLYNSASNFLTGGSNMGTIDASYPAFGSNWWD